MKRYFKKGGVKQVLIGKTEQIDPQVPGLLADGWVEVADLTPTPEAVQASLTFAVQQYLDSKAKERGYDSILSACSYAAAVNSYQAEGQKFVAWRAACWDRCYQLLSEVQAGTRAIPTEAELLTELPVLVLA